MNKFQIEMNTLRKKSGRTKQWLADSMKIQRCKFWRIANRDAFTPEQKQKIKNILK